MVVPPDQHIDAVLKKFRKLCDKSGVTWDAKRAAARFQKRGDRRRAKRSKARKRAKKQTAFLAKG